MRKLYVLLLLLVFVITGCTTEEPSIIPKETPEHQKSTSSPTSTPTQTPTQTPVPIPTPTPASKSYNYYELTPVDEANEAEEFFAFREELITNIKERNIDFLNKHFDEQGTWDFGGTTKEQILESWDEEIWLELQKAVLLGGTFFNEEKTVFIAPYTYQSFPEEFDAFEFEAATKDHVEVYIDKDVNSDVIAILTFSIVKRIYEDDELNSTWKKIELSDGRAGYVIGDNIRSPIDYRVGFSKEDHDWKINFFLAGD